MGRDLLFGLPVEWQMSVAERTYLCAAAEEIQPKRTVEVGCGASTFAFAEHSQRVLSIDKAPSREVTSQVPGNVRMLRGRSRWWLPLAIRLPGVALVLIDGDHSYLGARDDLNTVLGVRPRGDLTVLLHDTANDDCRAGIEAADWDGCPWLVDLRLDVVAPDTPGWGGLGVARLHA